MNDENHSMKNVEEKVSKIEKKIDPPERDLTARDILQTMTKLVIGLAISLAAAVVIFVGYTMYRDWQYNETITRITQQYNEFISQFEVMEESVTQDTTDGGNTNYIKGDGDITNGVPKDQNPNPTS